MADFTALKTAIQTYIKQNGNEEITGEKLQEILLSVVTTLGDSAINDLITALNDEVAARQNADGTLQQNITNEATARANGDLALSNRLGSSITAENTAAEQIGAEAEARAAADTALQLLIDGITNNIENGYVYAGIATPSSTPATGKVFYLALTAGTYTNFGSTVVSQGINILKYNGSAWSLDAFIGIDDEPTPNSPKLVKSGGTFESIMTDGSAFDISAHFASGGTLPTYADLSAALTALNTLSASYKRGGMSIKFVHTYNNKYVQYRLISDSFNTTINNWQGVINEPVAGSKDLISSERILLSDNRYVQCTKDATYGEGIYNQTTPTINDSLFITDYIPVAGGEIIFEWNASTDMIESNHIILAFYDSSKELITYYSNISNNVAPNTRNVTIVNAAYVRATFFTDKRKEAYLNINGETVFICNESVYQQKIIEANLNEQKAIRTYSPYIGGLVFKSVDDLEVGNITVSGYVDHPNRYRLKTPIDIPSTNNGFIRVVKNSDDWYIAIWYIDSNNVYTQGTITGTTNLLSKIPSDAKKVSFAGIYLDPERKITQIDLNSFDNRIYFEGCDNQQMYASISELQNEIVRSDYVITPGYSYAQTGTNGNFEIQEDSEWGLLGPIDISGLSGTPTLEVYLGDERTLNRYAVIGRENGINNNGAYMVQKGQRDINLDFTNTGQNRSKYLYCSIHLTEISDCYIKIKNTNTYLFKPNRFHKHAFQKLHKLRIAEWNVGHWSYGILPAGADMSDYERLMEETKVILTSINADILFVCEWDPQFDRDDTVNAYYELFRQFYPYYSCNNENPTGTVIFSKFPLSAAVGEVTSTHRNYAIGTVYVEGVDVKVMCCHANPFSVEDRITEFTELSSLFTNDSFAIVAGDLNTGNNSESSSDIQSELAPFIDSGFVLGNHGYFGTKNTYKDNNFPLDNIMCKGINLCSFTVLNENAASDHLPCYSDISFYK